MSMILRRFPDLPPVWGLGFALASVALGRWLPPGAFTSALFHYLGLGLILVGFLLIGWAALWFRRKRTTIEPSSTPTRLIVEGPFKVNRNPIYTGMALIVFGAAFTWGGPLSLLLAAGFPPLITRRFILEEEAALRTAFGREAEEYIAQSRRW